MTATELIPRFPAPCTSTPARIFGLSRDYRPCAIVTLSLPKKKSIKRTLQYKGLTKPMFRKHRNTVVIGLTTTFQAKLETQYHHNYHLDYSELNHKQQTVLIIYIYHAHTHGNLIDIAMEKHKTYGCFL